MSEIKGQLLGILLVLMVFGAISGAVIAIFNNMAKQIENSVSNVINDSTSKTSIHYLNY